MKKGFTLIELLAVIVVLAIIAIIAIPIITNVIDKAKQGALKDSAYGILDSAEMYLAKNMNKGIVDTMEFTCNNGKCLSGTEEIDYKGKIESGKVRIYTDSKIELCVTDNKSSALKTVTGKKVEVATGTCDYGELNYGVTALVSKEALDAKQRELEEKEEALDEMTTKYNDFKSLADQSNITAADVASNKKALINGEIVTGTLTSNSFGVATLYNGSRWSVPKTGKIIFDMNIMVECGGASVAYTITIVNQTTNTTYYSAVHTSHSAGGVNINWNSAFNASRGDVIAVTINITTGNWALSTKVNDLRVYYLQ